MLVAYVIGLWDDYDDSWSEPRIFAAESSEQAVRMAFTNLEESDVADVLKGDDDYSVRRAPEFDNLAVKPGQIKMTSEDERNAGWLCDGESMCEECGLYACGMDKYHVCPECYQCVECGHADDCPERDTVSDLGPATPQSEPRS